MRRHSFKESLLSFFEPHLHPDKGELLKATKTEIDEKVKRILKIVESGDIEDDESKGIVVAELVKDFSKEYESLYRQYDELTGEIRKKVHGNEENENSSSSSSDSDSDKKSKTNGRDSVKKQLEAANLEIVNLKRNLAITVEELEKKTHEMEAELDREKQENSALLNQINDVQKALLDQEAAYNTLNQEHKQINGLFEERETTIKKLTDEYKQAREMLEETVKDVTLKETEIVNMEETMERLRTQVEMKGEEIESMMEKMNDIEVKLRLSNQKLRITEQAVIEKEEELNSIEAKHLEKQALLEEKIVTTHETYRGMIEKVSSKMVNRFETLSEKVEEKLGRYEVTVVEAKKMVLKGKKCLIELKNEKEEMEKKFKGKVREDEVEKEKLEERLLGLGEEKREAIRQLCVWSDHNRERSEYLEEVLSKMVVARGQRRL